MARNLFLLALVASLALTAQGNRRMLQDNGGANSTVSAL